MNHAHADAMRKNACVLTTAILYSCVPNDFMIFLYFITSKVNESRGRKSLPHGQEWVAGLYQLSAFLAT